MRLGIDGTFLILFGIIIIDVLFIIRIMIIKYKSKVSYEYYNYVKKFFMDTFIRRAPNKQMISKLGNDIVMKIYTEIWQNMKLDENENLRIMRYLMKTHVIDSYMKMLNSSFSYRRKKAATYLGYINIEKCRIALEKAIQKEKNPSVKLFIVNSISNFDHEASLPILVGSLEGASTWYQEKVREIIIDYGQKFLDYLPEIINDLAPEVRKLIIEFSKVYPSKLLKDYLLEILDKGDVSNGLQYEAVNTLSKLYYVELNNEKFLNHQDPEIRKIALKSMSHIRSLENVDYLINRLDGSETDLAVVDSLNWIMNKKPEFIFHLAKRFMHSENKDIHRCIAGALAHKIDYLIFRLLSRDKERISKIIKEVIRLGFSTETINFLNNNGNLELENELIEIMKTILVSNAELVLELRMHLDERMLYKLGLEKYEKPKKKRDKKKEREKIRWLYFLLMGALFIFPIIYSIRHWDALFEMSIFEHAKIYIIDFNYYLIYYSIAVNVVYLSLMCISFVGAQKQLKLWELKKISFLFKRKMVPGISILAPAYNEEKSIIESANSLLNLKYPDYELIIINDGSKDDTLITLINYFNLERVNYAVNYKLNTMTVKGVYKTPEIPSLTVVDKENGGKADSLNAGINIASKSYFCGIDADSLLEQDALLKLVSISLDSEVESLAMGGNVFPVNGCTVEKGLLSRIHIPNDILGRFQTVEYFRAFMTGRVGWATVKSLMIISGAFGLFSKEKIIEIGGYLTEQGKYRKDTVGEDMELVVRLAKHMRVNKLPYRIEYAFNANCWTEVPEHLTSLLKQRDRWHRGLIDILSFHRGIIMNPKFGRMGLVAFPYFFIFEMLGPLFEFQGYVMVVLAAILGLLNMKIALMLFISTIFLGTMISLTSLLIAEYEVTYFRTSEFFTLIGYSIIENFGFRQAIGIWRVIGYVNSLRNLTGWGKIKRKGFGTQKS